jgi:hypothetical protein
MRVGGSVDGTPSRGATWVGGSEAKIVIEFLCQRCAACIQSRASQILHQFGRFSPQRHEDTEM